MRTVCASTHTYRLRCEFEYFNIKNTGCDKRKKMRRQKTERKSERERGRVVDSLGAE